MTARHTQTAVTVSVFSQRLSATRRGALDSLASRWGVDTRPGPGKTVWAEVPIQCSSRPHRAFPHSRQVGREDLPGLRGQGA
ncbi:hypothetical protein GCM10010510_02620 [Streptomyces anandii JCM 4720]|nr:hypothetical protein GCM10010510_02620 [Streptomyces anandii JCM 4720]